MSRLLTIAALVLASAGILSCGGEPFSAGEAPPDDSLSVGGTETASAGDSGGPTGQLRNGSTSGGEETGSGDSDGTSTSETGSGGTDSGSAGSDSGGSGGDGSSSTGDGTTDTGDATTSTSVSTGGSSGSVGSDSTTAETTTNTTGSGGTPGVTPSLTIVHPSVNEIVLCEQPLGCDYEVLVCSNVPDINVWLYGPSEHFAGTEKDPECPAASPYPVRATVRINDSGEYRGDWDEPSLFTATPLKASSRPEDGTVTHTVWVDSDGPSVDFRECTDPLEIFIDGYSEFVTVDAWSGDTLVHTWDWNAGGERGTVWVGLAESLDLPPGTYDLIATVTEPTGNSGTSLPCTITVAD